MKTYPTVVKFGNLTKILEMTAAQRNRSEQDLDREVIRSAHASRFVHSPPNKRYDRVDTIHPNCCMSPEWGGCGQPYGEHCKQFERDIR